MDSDIGLQFPRNQNKNDNIFKKVNYYKNFLLNNGYSIS